MANSEIRDSDKNCPACDSTLKERWKFGHDGTLAGGTEWQQQGRAYCPKGHRLEWTLDGKPHAF